jgi:ferredoxin
MTDLNLPDTTTNGRARAEALDLRHRPEVAPTSVVSFLSHGRVLVVGDEMQALELAGRLGEGLVATLFCPADVRPAAATVEGFTVVRGGKPELAGSLGSYTLSLAESGDEQESPAVALLTQARFDLVLDLGEPPLLQQEALPPGYYAPRGDREALDRILDELPEMRGEFEKPKYFNLDPEICAHGRRGVRGCTRCLDVCPAWAITSAGEHVTVDPNLCQGFGSCASVCPTGAITYAFPSTADLLGYVRNVLVTYRDSGGTDPVLVFFDSASASAIADGLGAALPDNALPVELEEVASIGIDAWMACLAYGARRVLVLTGTETPQSIHDVLDQQIGYAAPILEGSADVISLENPARFAPPPEKRLLLRTAINYLHGHAPAPKKVTALPAGAPFGQIKVDAAACTLCMSCVAVCPTSALREGQGLPQLNFVERACIQCGTCEKACPEDAISLDTRFLYDDKARGAQRLLHEEQPACCISCGKPFATHSMLKVMAKKLEDHWMFQSEADRRRLEMCDDCRVKDLMRAQQGDGPGPT